MLRIQDIFYANVIPVMHVRKCENCMSRFCKIILIHEQMIRTIYKVLIRISHESQ